ncbi:NADP-dependent oxidoreductase [Pararhizobium sp. BT-229]|uniref:NADP-dependent oxidoreductase n=1 Tax=Pararhizobium sp. BT-229 TaxID=2986923 RepID=UPI0021F72531|nr:NADP-dependent oxidoreductase [Pararhizobium sp. BT-229]MCV9960295.1 NADP-dependent oxidoreductase [Pararhizobium sp. BT-229]
MSEGSKLFSGKAWRVHEFGSPEVMKLEQIDTVAPAANEVIVKVHAAGVGPWDGWIRSGNSALPQPLPLILGSDISGEIVALGADITRFKVGDRIYGVTNKRFCGGYAEYAVATSTMIATKPTSIDDIEAASLPVIAVTAWEALFVHGRLEKGQSVLIHGAAGNVGAYAVQFASQAGIKTTCTVSAEDMERVRSLGAKKVIDYAKARFEDEVRDVDAVMDFVGGGVQTRSFGVLKKGGKLISAVSNPDQGLAERYGVLAKFFLVDVSTETLERITAWLSEGLLKVNVGATLPFDRAKDAHLMLEGKVPGPKGKIVLVLDTA